MEKVLVKCLFLLLVLDGMSSIFAHFTYEDGEWERMVVDLITRQLSTLPIHNFVDDPQLVQKVDRVNKLSIYMRSNELKGEEGRIVYRRKGVDSNLPILVLGSHEDNLKVFHRKRTFVVLRQNPLNLHKYFISYVYLRFWTDKQANCKETYLNEKICLEWDTWDNDRGEIKVKAKYFGWADCASSFLFSCPFQKEKENVWTGSDKTLELVDRGIRNTTLYYQVSNETKLTFVPSEGLPFDDTIDAFWDLETTRGEGAYIRETIRHASIFSKPESFVIKQTVALGRSLGSMAADKSSFSDKLKSFKEKSKQETANRARKKWALRKNLETRSSWIERRDLLNRIIRTYAQEMGFTEFFKIKNNPVKLKVLRDFRNGSAILDELQLLGDKFEVDESVEESWKKSEVRLLEAADEQPEADPSFGGQLDQDDNVNFISAFGRGISEIVVQSRGGGMTGRSLGDLDSKVAQTIAKSVLFSSTDTFQKPGWKLQGMEKNWKVNDTFRHELSIFYGLGSCAYKSPEPHYRNISPGNVSQVTEFFLTILRTYCLKEAHEYLHSLIQEKYLRVEMDHFLIPKDLFQSSQSKLGRNEFRKLSAALELASFSLNYGEELKHSWTVLESSNGISRSVHYLVEFGYIFISQARLVADEHLIKLCRNLVLSFRGVLTKLIQDYEILLGRCSESDLMDKCRWDIAGNYNDRYAIHSFIQFIIRGMAPIEQNKEISIQGLYKQFISSNQKPIKESFDFYSY